MNYKVIKQLPSAETIIQKMPLSAQGHENVKKDRAEIKAILAGNDPRLLVIVGPCSAWPKDAVLNYAEKLRRLNEKLKQNLKLVMRLYIQKPRTTKGWMGPVNQPDPFSLPDIELGIQYVRDMMVKVVEMGLPIADEALFTHNSKAFMELLSWVAIGARSTEDQEHRIFASAIDCAVGMKNPTHGSLAIGVNSIVAAQHPHIAVFDGYEVQTAGNLYAHLILRGSNHAPNYSLPHLSEVKKHMAAHDIKNPAVIIDASHDNCLRDGKKDHRAQANVITEVLNELKNQSELKNLVKGFMIESFIKEGNQKVDENDPAKLDYAGLSITDPCLSWEQTETLLMSMAEQAKHL